MRAEEGVQRVENTELERRSRERKDHARQIDTKLATAKDIVEGVRTKNGAVRGHFLAGSPGMRSSAMRS
jgi:hypothetical protein